MHMMLTAVLNLLPPSAVHRVHFKLSIMVKPSYFSTRTMVVELTAAGGLMTVISIVCVVSII